MRIIYDRDKPVPMSIRKDLTRLLRLWGKRVLPGWIYEINVMFDPVEDSAKALMCVRKDYLKAHLTITRETFRLDPQTLEETIVHELCHAYTVPIFDACDIPAEDPRRDFAIHEMEMSTEGMMHMLIKAYGRSKHE